MDTSIQPRQQKVRVRPFLRLMEGELLWECECPCGVSFIARSPAEVIAMWEESMS